MKRQKRDVPEFTPPEPNFIERIHDKNKSLSDDDLKSTKYLNKYFLRDIFSDYIYEINFQKSSKLVQINSYSLCISIYSKYRSHLYSISFPPSLTNIKPFAFKGCSFLNEITFLKNKKDISNLQIIDNHALSDTIIQSISIPSNIKKIGTRCFPSSLKSINFEKGAPELQILNPYAFSNLPIESFTMPINISPFLQNNNYFIGCKKLTNIVFDHFIDQDKKVTMNDEEEKNKEEKITKEKVQYKEKIQNWIENYSNVELKDLPSNEPTYDFATSFLLSQTKVEKIEVFVSNLNNFYFYNTPNLTKIELKSDKGRFIKQKGNIYTKDMKKLIVTERNIKDAKIDSNCQIITNYAFNSKSFKKVTFDENSKLKEISFFAFSESLIKDLILPNSLNHIDYGAFYKCIKLESINIPPLIDTIDFNTFSYTNLREITIPKNVKRIRYGCFFRCSKLEKVNFEKDSELIDIEDYAFAYTNLKSFLVPKNVKSIGYYSFIHCNNLKSIYFENSTFRFPIKESPFYDDKISIFRFPNKENTYYDDKINIFHFPNKENELNCLISNVKKIPFSENDYFMRFYDDEFINENGCIYTRDMKTLIDAERNMKEVKIKSECQSIAEKALSIKSIQKITFEKNSKLQEISYLSFSESQIKSINLPDSLKSIDYGAFYKCNKLETINLPPLIEMIDFFTFSYSCLKEITIPKNVNQIAYGSFFHCWNLEKVTFEKDSKLTEIGDYAFAYTNLKTFIVPKSVKSIGNYCFVNCGNLETLYFYDEKKLQIGEDCFQGTHVQVHNMNYDFNIAMSKEIYANYYEDKDNYYEENGLIYMYDSLIAYELDKEKIELNSHCDMITNFVFNQKSLKEITIKKDSELKTIGYLAFSESQIKTIYLPDCLESIYCAAFYKCNKLESINIPPLIDNLEYSLFSYSNLKEITIPNTVKKISYGCFYHCSNLEEVNINKDSQLTEIDDYAFAFTKLKTFSVSKNVEIIGNYCFINCTNLKTIHFYEESKLKTIGNECFKGTQISSLKLPQNIESFDFMNLSIKKINFSSNCTFTKLYSFMVSLIQVVSIPSSVECISKKAFFECLHLTEVTISNFEKSRLNTISDDAFCNCSSLAKFEIPKTVKLIGNRSFQNCEKFNAQIELINDNRVDILNQAFENSGIASIDIESNNVVINVCAFNNCKNLVEFSAKVTNKCILEKSSFQNTNALKSVKISIDVKNIIIKESCFNNSLIQSFEVPSSLTKIPIHCFKKCQNLTQVTFQEDSNITSFEEECFTESGIKSITIPSKTMHIYQGSFLKCTKLKNLSFSKNLKSCILDERAFAITAITKLNIPISINIIKRSCFEGCKNLKEVTFADNLPFTYIEERAFQSSGIEKLTFPSCINFIGKYSFKNCKQLKNLTFLAENVSIAPYAFTNCDSLEEINCESSVTIEPVSKQFETPILVTIDQKHIEKQMIDAIFVDKTPFYEHFYKFDYNFCILINKKYHFTQPFKWIYKVDIHNKVKSVLDLYNRQTYLQRIRNDLINPLKYDEINDPLFIIIEYINGGFYKNFKKNLIACDFDLEEITIPKETEIIETEALKYSKLQKVEFENGSQLKEIKDFAFENLSIKEIIIPDSVIVIGKSAFSRCSSLKKVNISSSSQLESIESRAFQKTAIESILLPPTLTKIDDFAFSDCLQLNSVDNKSNKITFGYKSFYRSSIKQIMLPKNSIFGDSSFKECKNLTQLTFLEEPNKIKFGEESFAFSGLKNIKIKYAAIIEQDAFMFCKNMNTLCLNHKSIELCNCSFAYSNLNSLIVNLKIKSQLNENQIDINDYFYDIFSTQIEKLSLVLTSNNGVKNNVFLNHKCLVENDTLVYADLTDNVSLFEKPTSEENDETIKKNEILRIPSNAKKLNFTLMSHLKKINWGSNCNVEDLGPEGFFSYYNLIEIKIPKSVTKLSSHLFEHCHYLRTIEFEDECKITEIPSFCFAYTKIEKCKLPKTIRIIGESSFYEDFKLKEIRFEGEIIKSNAFCYTGITEFKLSNNTEIIESNAFRYCHSLKKFELDINKSKLKEIGPYAFSETSIEKINIPPNISHIKRGVFNGCTSLIKVNISNQSTLKRIDRYSFSGTLSLRSMNIPKSINKISTKSFIDTPILDTIMEESNDKYLVNEDLSVYNKKGTLIFVPRTIKEYNIDDKCQIIGSSSFCGNNLEKIIFPEQSVRIIQNDSFSKCTSIKHIKIPKSVNKIGSRAFTGCSNLEKIEIDSSSSLEDIPPFCFSFSGLKTIILPKSIKNIHHSSFYFCQDLKNINLADTNVKYIGEYAFATTAIQNIQFPSSIRFISSHSFDNTKALKSIDLSKLSVIKTIDYCSKNNANQEDSNQQKTQQANDQKKFIVQPPANDFNENPHFVRNNKNKDNNNNDDETKAQKQKYNDLIVKPHQIKSRKGKRPNILRPKINVTNRIQLISKEKSNQTVSLYKIPNIKNKKNNESNSKEQQSTKTENKKDQNQTNNNNTNKDKSNQSNQNAPFISIISNINKGTCLINENAFSNSSVKIFKLNINEYEWFSFFDKCIEFQNYRVNDNIHLLVEKSNKEENYSDYPFYITSSLYKVTKLKWKNQTWAPLMKNQLITSFSISETTKYLNESNFSYCYNLKKVIFNENSIIKSIPKTCFTFSTLKEITIPDSVEVIESSAFLSCYYLQTITFSENSKLKTIKECAFSRCRKLNSINIPNSIQVIPKNCFSSTGLTSIELPNSITKIDSHAFSKCKKLRKVVLNNGLVEIGEFAFAYNCSLKRVEIPDSVTTIKSFSFFNCTNLLRVKTTDNTELIEIYNGAFDNTQIKELKIYKSAKKLFEPTKVPNLNKIIFCNGPPTYFIQTKDGSIYEKTNKFDKYNESNNSKISELESQIEQMITANFAFSTYYYSKTLNKNTKYVKWSYEYKCYKQIALQLLMNRINKKQQSALHLIFAPKKLECLRISENCLSIGNSILNDMKNLTTIEYRKGTSSSILNFPNYNHLYSGVLNKINQIKILSSYALLEERVFAHFESLEIIEIGESTRIPYIPKFAFLGCKNLQKIVIPSSCISIQEGAFKDCEKIESIEFKPNKKLKFIEKEAFYNCSSLVSIQIPSSVCVIAQGAFMNCQKLEKVEFTKTKKEEDHLEIIEKNAFRNCTSLSSFSLPRTCIMIGPAAFMDCTSLETFHCKGNKLRSIQSRTFYNCTSLKSIKILNVSYKDKVEYDENKRIDEELLESFDHYTFSIGTEAFMNCTSLIKVVIEDESKQIDTINLDEKQNPLFSYPSYLRLKIPLINKLFFNSRMQSIKKNAFCNCTSLTSVRFFLGNLECFHEKAFSNCKALRKIEINSKYCRYLLTEKLNLSAFEGTPKKLKIILYNKEQELKNPYLLVNKIKEQKTNNSKRLFKQHFSTLNKDLFNWEIIEENCTKTNTKSTVIDLFDGPKYTLKSRHKSIEYDHIQTPGPGKYDIERFPSGITRNVDIGIKLNFNSVFYNPNQNLPGPSDYSVDYSKLDKKLGISIKSSRFEYGSIFYMNYIPKASYYLGIDEDYSKFPKAPSFSISNSRKNKLFDQFYDFSPTNIGPAKYNLSDYYSKHVSVPSSTITIPLKENVTKKIKKDNKTTKKSANYYYKINLSKLNKSLLK